MCGKDCSLNPSTCICENSKYLKSVADTLVTKCDKNCYIGYVTIKKDQKIYIVNHLYLFFTNVNGYFEEISRTKCLTLVPTNESKEKKIEKLWIKIRDLIKSVTKQSDDYDVKKYENQI